MRVCMLAMLLPSHVTGGMEIHALDLGKGIVAAGHEVTIVTSRHPRGVEHETVDGVEIFYADCDATSKKPLGKAALTKLEELHALKRFDVIHSQSFSAFWYVKSGLKRRLGVPVVTTLHGTASNTICSSLNQGLTFMLIPKILFHMFNHHFRTKELVSESAAVIAISKELTETIPDEFGISPDKVKAIYNGIDTGRFRPKESPLKGRFGGKRVILSVCVLHKQKGVQHLIEAMNDIIAKVPSVHLLVVGDGPYRRDLEAQVARFGLKDRVTFEGKVDNGRIDEYYNAADAFAIPTICVEGLPLIELEAMACGKPVVASNIGGIPTVIVDGENGLLAKPGDVRELAEKIISVLSDAALASRLGSAARKTIESGFSRQKMVADTIKVYEGAVSS